MIDSFRSGTTSNTSLEHLRACAQKMVNKVWDEGLRRERQRCKQSAQWYHPWDFPAGAEHWAGFLWGRVICCAEYHSLPGLFPSSSEQSWSMSREMGQSSLTPREYRSGSWEPWVAARITLCPYDGRWSTILHANIQEKFVRLRFIVSWEGDTRLHLPTQPSSCSMAFREEKAANYYTTKLWWILHWMLYIHMVFHGFSHTQKNLWSRDYLTDEVTEAQRLKAGSGVHLQVVCVPRDSRPIICLLGIPGANTFWPTFAYKIFQKSLHELQKSLHSPNPLFRNPKAIKVEVALVKAEIPFELKLNVPLTGIHPGDLLTVICSAEETLLRRVQGPGRDFFKLKLTPRLCWPMAWPRVSNFLVLYLRSLEKGFYYK